LDLLKQCIRSLAGNELSAQSELYVVSDAAMTDKDISIVRMIREYVNDIDCFKNVTLIARDKNLGSFVSINSAIDTVINEHRKVIFLEDDNIVSPNFLKFMNDCLDFYRDNKTVFSISGYNYPIAVPQSYKHDIYMWSGFSAWGVGLWKDKWANVDWTVEGVGQFLANKSYVRTLNNTGEHALFYLKYFLMQDKIVTDILVCLHLVKTNMYSVFPVISKVRNVGHDGRGEHGKATDRYLQQEIDTDRTYVLVNSISPDERINRILRNHFKIPFKTKIVSGLGARIPHRLKEELKHMLSR